MAKQKTIRPARSMKDRSFNRLHVNIVGQMIALISMLLSGSDLNAESRKKWIKTRSNLNRVFNSKNKT